RNPIADALSEGLAGAIGVIDDEGLLWLASVHGGGENLQRCILRLGQENRLTKGRNSVIDAAGAKDERRAVPGQRAAQQVAGIRETVAVEPGIRGKGAAIRVDARNIE